MAPKSKQGGADTNTLGDTKGSRWCLFHHIPFALTHRNLFHSNTLVDPHASGSNRDCALRMYQHTAEMGSVCESQKVRKSGVVVSVR